MTTGLMDRREMQMIKYHLIAMQMHRTLIYLNVVVLFRINMNDHTLDISFEEWRDYLLFHPSAELADIIAHWRHNTVRITS